MEPSTATTVEKRPGPIKRLYLWVLSWAETPYGTPVPPVVQTGTEIIAATREGQLVRVDNWVVTTVGTGSFAFTVTGTADGETIQLRVGSQIKGITPASFTVGESYSIVGVLSRFNATMQIKPRSIDDITVTP